MKEVIRDVYTLSRGFTVRDGFIFCCVTPPANVYDAIVIRNPAYAATMYRNLVPSMRSLEEHIQYINKHGIEKAYIIAEDIDFLLDCPSIRYVRIASVRGNRTSDFYSPLYSMPEICYLDYSVQDGIAIDYPRIKGLQCLRIEDCERTFFPTNIPGLKSLSICDKLADGKDTPCERTLDYLNLSCTNIRTLNGLENTESMKYVELSYNRVLSDVSALKHCGQNLKILRIENCPKITDFSFLYSLSGLVSLRLNGKNELQSLDFLQEMPNLSFLNLSMTVLDNDISPCLKIPRVCLKGKRSYSLQDKDLPKNVTSLDFEGMGLEQWRMV